MTRVFHRPVLLDDGHELDGFECRSEEQTNWLGQYARQSSNVGTTRVLVVHAESSQARDFNLHLVPEFESSPTDDLHLILLMKDIRRTIG